MWWSLLPSLFRKPFGGLHMVASSLSLITLFITSNWCNHGGELMVNRCHSKPKCHADTDFHAPSGQKMPSKARRCIHKLAVELATAGNGGKWVAFSLDWFGVAHPCQLFFSTRKLEGEVQGCLHQVVKSELLESMLQHTPAFLDSWGLTLWEEAHISYFRLSFSCNYISPEWLGQLFWTLLLWICLVSETHRIFTICIFTNWFCVGVDTTFGTWNLARCHLAIYGGGSEFCKFCSNINAQEQGTVIFKLK